MDNFFHPSLFPSKKDFDSNKFLNAVKGTEFEKCIYQGVANAWGKTKEVFRNGDKSLILLGQYLHEEVFNFIRKACRTLMPNEDIIFYQAPEGNKKSFFTYKGYIFIIKKSDVVRGKTEPNLVIKEQLCDSHVITIEYVLDELRENITSTAFLYKKGNITIFSYVIPNNNIEIDKKYDIPDPSPFKPTFNNSIRKNINNEAL